MRASSPASKGARPGAGLEAGGAGARRGRGFAPLAPPPFDVEALVLRALVEVGTRLGVGEQRLGAAAAICSSSPIGRVGMARAAAVSPAWMRAIAASMPSSGRKAERTFQAITSIITTRPSSSTPSRLPR